MKRDIVKFDTTYRKKNAKRTAHVVRDTVLIGDWEEVQGIDAQTLKPELSAEKLDGLIIKGYEMKFGKTNENGERYDKEAFDEFINRYFVNGKLNMPVDINHEGVTNWQAYCGRVLYIEVNNVGFYFAVYIPRTYQFYNQLLFGLKNGIIQGFSKEGFVGYDDYEIVWNADGTFAYEQIYKMSVVSVSLVCTPANGLPFEQMKETKNVLVYTNKTTEEKSQGGKTLAELFNIKPKSK